MTFEGGLEGEAGRLCGLEKTGREVFTVIWLESVEGWWERMVRSAIWIIELWTDG